MTLPHKHTFTEDIGLTGAWRGRRQPFTGRVVIQVEVLRRRTALADDAANDLPPFTDWRDATPEEAFRVRHRVGLVAPALARPGSTDA